MGLIPRDEKYFEQLRELAVRIHRGAEALVRLFDDMGKKSEYLREIKDIEHECDKLSGGIIERLNASFITPIDREDIYLLASELDDVMDRINDVALMTVLYGVKEGTEPSRQMARILMNSVLELEPAIGHLEARRGVRDHIQRVKQLEEEGDRVWQDTVQRLFEEETNAVELIRWMGIYDKMEAAIDRCNDVAKALEGIVVKNA